MDENCATIEPNTTIALNATIARSDVCIQKMGYPPHYAAEDGWQETANQPGSLLVFL